MQTRDAALNWRMGSLSCAVSNFVVLISEQSILAADAEIAASNMTMVQYQIAVFKALDGGWRERDLSNR